MCCSIQKRFYFIGTNALKTVNNVSTSMYFFTWRRLVPMSQHITAVNYRGNFNPATSRVKTSQQIAVVYYF